MCAMFAAMLLIYGHTQYIASQINEPTRLQLAKVRSFIETQYIIPSGYRNLEITDSLIPNPGIETRGPETWQQVYVAVLKAALNTILSCDTDTFALIFQLISQQTRLRSNILMALYYCKKNSTPPLQLLTINSSSR